MVYFNRMFWYIILLFFQISVSSDCPDSQPICWDDGHFDRLSFYSGSKTSYEYMKRKGNLGDNFESGCEPSKVWMFIRHGTRYPKSSQISKFKHILYDIIDKLKLEDPSDCLCHDKYSSLVTWNWEHLNDSHHHQLTSSGAAELRELGERLKMKFPTLFTNYTPELIKLAHTATARAKDSAENFVVGLFGSNISVDFPQPSSLNHILRAYKTCHNWRESVKRNPETYLEVTKFQDSKWVSNVISNIKSRLGMENINLDDVISMYEVCAYENAWMTSQVSPWCSLFSEKDLEVMNYEEDLELYYKDGPHHPLSRRVACGTLLDIIEQIEGTIQKRKNDPKGLFYFSHCGALLKIFSLLKFYSEESPLQTDNFSEKRDRMWRSSEIVPFAGNLLLTIYNCNDTHKISVHVSEKILFLPFCGGQHLCPAEVFLSWANGIRRDECRSLEELCEPSLLLNSRAPYLLLVVIPALSIYYLWLRTARQSSIE